MPVLPCALLSDGVVLLLSHGEVYGHARVRGLFPRLAALFVLVAELSSLAVRIPQTITS